jgi:N utilization substance protein B
MLNRRFLRIKAFQALYGFSREGGSNNAAYRKRMLDGLDKTFELYLFLLSFPQEFNNFLITELEGEKEKYYPSEEQKTLLQILSKNKVIHVVENNIAFKAAFKDSKLIWDNKFDLFRQIWSELKVHELFLKYLKTPDHSLAEDKALVLGLTEWVCSESDAFEAYVEDRFSNWEDDQVLVLTTLQKTIQMLKETSSKILPEKHKDEEEDLRFVKSLFDLCIQNDSEFMQLIASKTQNWDQDRIALVDLILMKMALCEVIHFPYIPIKVSINEYLELAKLYSTPNSHGFINGILDKVQQELRKESKINKLGRGLVD